MTRRSLGIPVLVLGSGVLPGGKLSIFVGVQGSHVKFHDVSSFPTLSVILGVGLQQKRSDREVPSEGLAAGVVGPAWEVTLASFSCARRAWLLGCWSPVTAFSGV